MRINHSLAHVVLITAYAPGLAAGQSLDFEKDVLPIIKQSCMDCHGEPTRRPDGRLRKPKGGLRLDGKEWILKGGHDGGAVVPGKPDKSALLLRASLPADDADLMPPDGPRLSEKNLAVLRDWIASGAEFGDWDGLPAPIVEKSAEKGPAPFSGAARIAVLSRLGEGVSRASSTSIDKAAGDDARITPVMPESPLLRVEFPGAAEKVDDGRLKELSTVFGNVTQLLAGNTGISDKSLITIAKMKRLTHLDLHGTAITSKQFKYLEVLTELRYLNLHGTEIDDEALATLVKLPRLQAVYLWNTDVTEEGAARLQLQLPRCRVSSRLELPEPAVRDDTPPRRRRGN